MFVLESHAWDGIGTGIVTGLITGVVAFGLFFGQRALDRKTAREQRTRAAVDTLLRATDVFVGHCIAARRTHEPLETRVKDAWYLALVSTEIRSTPESVRVLLRSARRGFGLYNERRFEVEAAYPIDLDNVPDERDVTAPIRRDAFLRLDQGLTALAFAVNETLSAWDLGEVLTELVTPRVLETPFQAGTPKPPDESEPSQTDDPSDPS